jgi:hypothetical protein
MTLDSKYISSRSKLPIDLITLLLSGLTKSELADWISSTEGLKGEANEVRRMNIIGSLRGLGYQVTGGRKGRSQPYQIIGWTEKKDTPGVEAWSLEDRATLATVHQWSEILTPDDIRQLIDTLDKSDLSERHENSILQVWSYELANNRGFIYRGDTGSGIVIQKNIEKPSFKVIPLSLSLSDVVHLVQMLGPISYQPVVVLNTSFNENQYLKANLGGRIEKAQEAIYDVRKIATFDGRSHKSVKNVTRLGKTLRVESVEWIDDYLLENVISSWRSIADAKQRQLSITRDYRAIHARLPSKITTVGIRNGRVASFQILDWMPGTSMVAQIVEKSLNFRTQPGGESGTSDFSLWRTCQILDELDVTEINAGRMSGGTKGLEDHKLRLLSRVVVATNFIAETYKRR